MAIEEARKTKWAQALREARDEVLLDVRVQETGGAYDFLLVYPPGCGSEAVKRFGAALRGSGDIPPFEIMGVEEHRAHLPWFAEYRSL
jgi:hypothetical protein